MLLIGIVTLMIIGYFLMDRIDMLLVRNTEITHEIPIDRRSVLIFSDPESENIFCEMFEELKCSYYITDNTIIPENLEFNMFFALSSDDAENIFFSKLIRRKKNEAWIVAKVNVVVGNIAESLQEVNFND